MENYNIRFAHQDAGINTQMITQSTPSSLSAGSEILLRINSANDFVSNQSLIDL